MTQLSFSIRTTTSCKTVHLVGSWDGYAGQLPLAKDKGSKKDAWTGTFRFNASVIRDGERYWYYYVIDGYHVAHDPACDSMVEPKTGRRLNLMVLKDGVAVRVKNGGGGSGAGGSKESSSSTTAKGHHHSKSAKPAKPTVVTSFTARRHARHGSVDVPCGRPVSPSQIKAPQPLKPPAVLSPRAASAVSAAQVSEHGSTTVAHLAAQLERTRLADERRAALGDGEDWDAWASGTDSECGGSDTSASGTCSSRSGSSSSGGRRSSSSACSSDIESEPDFASSSSLSTGSPVPSSPTSSRGSDASSRTSNSSSPDSLSAADCNCVRLTETRSDARVRTKCNNGRCGGPGRGVRGGGGVVGVGARARVMGAGVGTGKGEELDGNAAYPRAAAGPVRLAVDGDSEFEFDSGSD